MFQYTHLLFVFTLYGCSNDTVIEKKTNQAPSVLIVSHTDGAQVPDGLAEFFRATVSDDDNEYSELQYTWYVGETQVCDWDTVTPAGDATCDIVFQPDDEKVLVEVRDPQGAAGIAELQIDVLETQVPVAEIFQPVGGATYYSDQLIQFSGMVFDEEDEYADLMVNWSSSLDGSLSLDTTVDSNGELSDYGYLTEGNHAIELMVEDSSGKFSSAEVVIQVGGQNNTPSCLITEPADSSSFVVGDTITFRGTAEDLDIQSNELSVEWVSDKDGSFGTSTPTSSGNITFAYDGLSADTHTISMNVSDEVGALCTEQILLEIGNPPSVSIDEPIDGTLFAFGEPVLFRATVSDSEDQPGQLETVWTSDIDGVVQSGFANSQGISQFSSSSLSAGLHSVSLSVTDTSGLISDDLVTIQINTPPVVDSIQLNPDPLFSNVNLTAVASFSDADGQSVTATYEWFEDGIATSVTGTTINASMLDVGEVWSVRVTPNDGYADGAFSEASITVSNTAPVIANVSISPNSSVFNDSVLTCSSVATDVDETVTPTYSWELDGVVYSGSYLDLANTSAAPGDVATCTVSVTDTQGANASSSATVSIGNRAPSLSNVVISPNTNVATDATIACNAISSDVDGETSTVSYEWTSGTQSLGFSASLNLSGLGVLPGSVVECTATAMDTSGATSSAATTITLVNTPPVVDTLTLTPAQPSATETILCSATASDADGDTPSLTFSFMETVSGVSLSPTTTTSSSAELDLSTLNLTSGATIECSVEAVDAHGGSVTDSISVEVGNSMPTMSAVVITPSTNVYTDTVLVCSTSATDPDDGLLTPSYEWTLSNGTVLSNSASYTVLANQTDVGDTLVCTAAATDSEGQQVSDSASVVLLNTAPTLSSGPTVSLSQAEIGDSVFCSASGADIDGQTVSISYSWLDQNNTVVGSGSTLTISNQPVGTLIRCRASASDGLLSSGDVDSGYVEVINTIPVIGNATISPNSGLTTSSLLTCSATATDENDGTLSVSYAWTASNGATHTGSTWQLDSTVISPNDTISCVASATDNNGATVQSNPYVVSLNNSAPVVTNVAIFPNSGVVTGTSLTCVANGSDPDDGALTPTFVWSVNGTDISTGASYTVNASQTNAGDVLVCTANVEDSDGQTASNTASVTIQNSAPSLDGTPTLSASQFQLGDTVNCIASGSDADGDTVSLSYQWLDSNDNVLGASSSLLIANLDVGETVRCTVSISDGTSSGTSRTSTNGTVINSAPTLTAPTISPSSGITTSTLLTCSATANDVNDGALSVSYTWVSSGGATHTGATWQLDTSTIAPSETIQCTATATDAQSSTISATSSSVAVGNSNPSVSNISISPNSGVYTGTTLVCSASASDPDDGTLTPTFVWSINGNQISSSASYTVSSVDSDVGDTIVCTATATDSAGQSSTQTASVVVSNTGPTLSSVSISPSSSVVNDDTLTCSASANDIDESVSPSFSWTKNGTEFATGSTVALQNYTINPTDIVGCVATVEDSNGGSATSNASVTVINRSPELETTTISDSTPEANDTITCSSSVSDDDGESVSVSYEWSVSSSVVGTSSSLTLTPSSYPVGTVILCTVSSSDSYGGTVSESVYATVQNTTPTIGSATISPTTGLSTSSLLTCTATASDLNDGSLSVDYSWSTSAGSTHTGSTWQLNSSVVSLGDTINCTASATDNNGSTVQSNVASIVLSNSAPSISSIAISPSSGIFTGTELTCSASASDPDDGVLTPSYSWSVGGTVVSSSSSYTISASDTDVGDTIICTATATDSSSQTATSSTSVIVKNTDPVLSGIDIASQSGIATSYFNDDVLVCSVSITDPDESLTADFAWKQNGTEIANGDTIDLGAFGINPSDDIQCVASVSDSSGASDSLSDTVSIGNRTPTVPSVTINNTSPEADDTLTCSASASDADGDSTTITYSWSVNSNTISSTDTLVLTSSLVEPGTTIVCLASATDAYGAIGSNVASATVINTAPTISTPVISASGSVFTDSKVQCSASASDLNDGALSVSYTWSSSNGETSSGNAWQLSNSLFSPGDELLCTATATDSDGQSVSSTSAAVEIENRPPSISSVQISPDTDVVAQTSLTCTSTNSDEEDGTLTPSYEWSVSGTVIASGDTYVVDPAQAAPGDSLVCQVTVTDGNGASDSVSTAVTISNTSPSIDSISVTPTQGYNDTVFSCAATASDLESSVSLSYAWTDGNGTSLSQSDSFNASSATLYPGDTVTCTVVATDTEGASNSQSSSVVLDNRKPSTPIVNITWNAFGSSPQTGDTLTCYGSSTDPDGTPISLTYSWFTTANGGPGTGQTMPGQYVVSGEFYTCMVVAFDGSETSQGSKTVQATGGGGTQIKSVGSTLIIPSCGDTACDWSLDVMGETLDFVTIDAGGEPLGRYEGTSDLLMMTTEVSQAAFSAIQGSTVQDNGDTFDQNGSFGVGDDYPMYNVSWHDAAAFANQVTSVHNQSLGAALDMCYTCSYQGSSVVCSQNNPILDCSGYRLPTEAEWEYAARSASTLDFWTEHGEATATSADCLGTEELFAVHGTVLAWAYQNYCGTQGYGSQEVATTTPNDFGLFDMHGNVAEWTEDTSGCSFPSSFVDPLCTIAPSIRVVRGGSWLDTLYDTSASARAFSADSTRSSSIGFRLVRSNP